MYLTNPLTFLYQINSHIFSQPFFHAALFCNNINSASQTTRHQIQTLAVYAQTAKLLAELQLPLRPGVPQHTQSEQPVTPAKGEDGAAGSDWASHHHSLKPSALVIHVRSAWVTKMVQDGTIGCSDVFASAGACMCGAVTEPHPAQLQGRCGKERCQRQGHFHYLFCNNAHLGCRNFTWWRGSFNPFSELRYLFFFFFSPIYFLFACWVHMNIHYFWGFFLGIPCCKTHRKLPTSGNAIQPEIVSVAAGP